MIFVIMKQNKAGKWFWCLVGGNGETLATSQPYSSKGACKKTAEAVSDADVRHGVTIEAAKKK